MSWAGSTSKRADGLADEPKVLTLGAYGDGMDFFALKGAVEAVLKQLRIENVRFLADSENPSYHPGRCAKVYVRRPSAGRPGPDPSPCGRATTAWTPSCTAAELRLRRAV